MSRPTKLELFRAAKDKFYARDRRAPLTSQQQRSFKALAYFPENEGLIVKARIDRQVEPGTVLMETTHGRPQEYWRYGRVHFEVDGHEAAVTLYASAGSNKLFLPFRDVTSGTETYGSGRYLDLVADGDDIEIDFNYAYNPYCAYNAKWNCPLPPSENWLQVPIRAGEKAFSMQQGA